MYRIIKVLNHNTIIGIHTDDNHEYLIMGKGIGFGRKVAERIEARPDDKIYSLRESTERGNAKELVTVIQPVFLEIANEILTNAEQTFQKLDRNVLFPMADHLAFAVKRMQTQEQISNPLTGDIRVLFHMEFKAAEYVRPILKERLNVTITDDEIGYIALHIHSAIQDESISQAMQMAQAVRECISFIEETTGRIIDIQSLSYNRLMNHMRYMVARTISGEQLKISMNDYMSIKFPHSYQMAQKICKCVAENLKVPVDELEIGYLAIHIERVLYDELDSQKRENS